MKGLVTSDGVTPLASVGPRGAKASTTPYSAADPMSQELAGWNPYRGSADGDLLADRPVIDARARDLLRNNGWADGFRQRQTDKTIGARLRLSAKPHYRALGQTAEWAREWGRQVEAAWMQFADDPARYCDVGRRLDMGGIQAQAYGHYLAEGDALAVLHWREDRPGARYRTAVQVLDPDRLSNPNDAPDDDRLRGGVEMNEDGAPVAFHIRKAHPGDFYAGTAADAYTWERVERETPWGRPIVIHHYDAHRRAGLTRGVSALASVLARLKMLDKYESVELQAAVLNAILCAFIESPFDPKALEETLTDGKLGEYQDLRSAFHKERNLTLGGVKLPALFAGEKIGFQTASRPNAAFAAFEAASLRGVAAGLGTSYEELTQDWTQTNYSSARAALLESWFTLSARRQRFAGGFMVPLFSAWLEDAIDLGDVELPPGAPDFHDARAAYTRSLWLGPGRGWVDPTKEKQGAVMGISAGLSTLEKEAAEQGLDWEEVLDQIRVEIAEMPDGMLHPAKVEFSKLIGTESPPELPAGRPGGHA